jgi:hypothetical protein
MDENQTEETETYSTTANYVVFFSTVVAAGLLVGASIVAGGEAAFAAKDKIQKIRKERAAKKNAKTKN